MQKLTYHRMVGGWLVVCLLLTFSLISFAQYPNYPRAMDQVYVYMDGNYTLRFEQDATLHNPVRFMFPEFSDDVLIFFDYDNADSNPIEPISSGEIKSVTYPAPGQYRIRWAVEWISGYEYDPLGNPIPIYSTKSGFVTFQTNFNADVNYNDFLPHETWGDITGNTYTPPSNNAYPSGSPWNSPTTAGGIVSVLYANPDHKFRKPFILIDGFDPVLRGPARFEVRNPDNTTLGYGAVRWDVLMTGREESFDFDPNEPGVPHTPRFRNFPTLVQGLRAQGYDIVLVDLADGGTYIQANGEFLIKVIERINERKSGTFPNALFGASMGGFIGRYALAKMEKEGKKHCTGLFGTVDTPNNGANIPLSLQAFTFFSHLTGAPGDPLAQAGWSAAETPAARQMLIQHFGEEVQSGRISMENIPIDIPSFPNSPFSTPLSFDELSNSDYAALRNQLKADLASFGWPKEPRKVAILDGMKDGTMPGINGFGDGDKIYDAIGKVNDANFGTVFKIAMYASNGGGPEDYALHGIPGDCTGKWNFYPHEEGDILFKMAQPSDLNPCPLVGPVPYKYYNITVKSQTNLLHLDNAPGGYRMDLRQLHDVVKSKIEDSGAEFINTVKFPIATFTPTWSSLAMATPLNNTNLFVDLTTSEFLEENLPNAKVPNFDNFYAPETSLRHVELDGGMVAFILDELARLNASPQEGVLTETYNYGRRYKEIPTTIVSSTGRLNINNTGATGYVSSNPDLPANKPSFTTYLRDCGQRIDVEAGGEYNIGALDKSQHGITEVWKDGVVHIRTGGKLRITSDGSQLYIKKGATLIIDPGAIIILESEGSNILIEGDLIVNGDFHFSGLGFFDFSAGNQLIYGNGYTTFNLKGAGKDKRFVRLSAHLNISDAHRLNWTNGLVEVAGSVILTAGAGLTFTGMTLQGIGGSTAIDALNSGAITLESCDVESLDLAIQGDGGQGCVISACNFSNYLDRQVTWVSAPAIQILYSMFDGTSGFHGLWLENVLNVIIKGSIFERHGDPLTGQIDDNDLLGAGSAIELFDVAVCLVMESHFSDNAVGIKSRDNAHPSNIFVLRNSSFTENEAGIFVNGDDTQGAVLSDCSLFDKNGTAIRGRDIALMIDSQNSSASSFDTDTPNRFIRNTSGPGPGQDRYIRICYDMKAVGGSVLMRNNYWGEVGSPDPAPQDFIFLQNALFGCLDNTPALLQPFAIRMTDCGPYEHPASFSTVKPGTECTLSTGSTPSNPITVHEQFQLGTFLMRNEDYVGAIDALRPVAALWQPNMTTFSDNCQQYIKVAKAFVDGNDGSGIPRSSGGQGQSQMSEGLLIAPNPTANEAIIYLSEPDCLIRVWDLQGKLVFQTRASGSYRIETAAWLSGVYLVEVQIADGVRKSGKLIVQK